jgi:hypothetical protein
MKRTIAVLTILIGLAAELKATTIRVQGSVYYDSNQNGVKDIDEFGVGGVKLFLNHDDQDISTDERGRYQIETSTEDEYITLSLNQDFLPAGSLLTTPPTQVIGPNHLYSDVSFGIRYPLETFKYPREGEESIRQESEDMFFYFKLKDDQLILNDIVLMTFPGKASKVFNHQIKLEFKKAGPDPNKIIAEVVAQFREYAKRAHVNTLLIKRPANSKSALSSEELDQFTEQLEKAIRAVITVEKIQKSDPSGSNSLEIIAELSERNLNRCRIYVDSSTFEVSALKQASIKIGQKSRVDLKLDCPDSFKKARIDILDDHFIARFDDKTLNGQLKKEEQEDLKHRPINAWLEIQQGKLIHKNRDHFAQLQVKGVNLKSFSINGKIYAGDQKSQTYLHKGRAGKNTLKIRMVEKDEIERVARHRFKLMEQRKFYFSSTLDSYALESMSSKFNYSYNIPTQRRLNTQALVFPTSSYGLHLNHVEDSEPSTTDLVGGGRKNYRRREDQIHGVYRFKIFHQGFYAPVLHLYGGIQVKEAGLPTDSVFHFPAKFSGISLGAELYKEYFLSRYIENSSAVFVASDGSDHTFKFIQEIRYNLNYVGKLLGIKPTYVYGPVYGIWGNFRLVAGINYEIDKRIAENADAVVSDKLVAYRIGVAFQY